MVDRKNLELPSPPSGSLESSTSPSPSGSSAQSSSLSSSPPSGSSSEPTDSNNTGDRSPNRQKMAFLRSIREKLRILKGSTYRENGSSSTSSSMSSLSGEENISPGGKYEKKQRGRRRTIDASHKRNKKATQKRHISLDSLGNLLKKMIVSNEDEMKKKKKEEERKKPRSIWRSPNRYRKRNLAIRKKLVGVGDVCHDSTEQYIRCVFLD